MICPRCHQTLIPKDYEHLSVSACKSCGGIWLSPSQLCQILTLRDEQFSAEEIQNTLKASHPGLSAADTSSTLACPICSQTMEEINYDYSSGVIVNSCPQGDGLWFDKNELEEVQIYMEHWDDEENKRQKDLLAKLEADREDVIATEEKELEEDKKQIQTLSKTSVLERVFKLFDSMKRDE